ncbi:MAG: hypothetical protein R3F60_30555 [bacterium]
MAGLPLVLCGPMVRRVTRETASVFVALHGPATVRLRVFEEREKPEAGGVGALLMEGGGDAGPGAGAACGGGDGAAGGGGGVVVGGEVSVFDGVSDERGCGRWVTPGC